MKQPVIVPLDGSQLAEQALPFGLSLAKQFETDLLLLQVLPRPESRLQVDATHTLSVDEQQEALVTAAESYLTRVSADIQAEEMPQISFMTCFGPPGEMIAQVADDREATYIVMSTHGYTGFTRWALGSVTDKVLHLTKRPMLVYRPPTIQPLTPMTLPDFKNIVVPMEALPLAEEVLPHVRDIARVYGKNKISLFSAVPAFPAGFSDLEVYNLKRAWRDSQKAEAKSYLGRMVRELEADGDQVTFTVGVGAAANAILRHATKTNADLIIMATHARDGLNRFILGSVTDRVVRAGKFPVLVIRPASDV